MKSTGCTLFACTVTDGRTIAQLMNGNVPALLRLWITWQKFAQPTNRSYTNERGQTIVNVERDWIFSSFFSLSFLSIFDAHFYHKQCHPSSHAQNTRLFAFAMKREAQFCAEKWTRYHISESKCVVSSNATIVPWFCQFQIWNCMFNLMEFMLYNSTSMQRWNR